MPIIVKVNPVRVEEVEIQAKSDAWEKVLFSTWPIVRKHLRRLNKDLRENASKMIIGTGIKDNEPFE